MPKVAQYIHSYFKYQSVKKRKNNLQQLSELQAVVPLFVSVTTLQLIGTSWHKGNLWVSKAHRLSFDMFYDHVLFWLLWLTLTLQSQGSEFHCGVERTLQFACDHVIFEL